MLDTITAARALFGLSIGFHIIFAVIGVGLPLFLLIIELLASRTGDEMYKQMAVRWHRRAETVGDVDREMVDRMLFEADCSVEEAEAIYKLTSLCTFDDRFVIPPMYREQAIEMIKDPHEYRRDAGFGFVGGPRRGL